MDYSSKEDLIEYFFDKIKYFTIPSEQNNYSSKYITFTLKNNDDFETFKNNFDIKIKLEFDSQLKETIDRYPFMGRPYIYHGCSGGQRRRLNLSVAAAFAYIQLLKTGCSPSVIWLDEITMNMDEIGVDGIYRMICELAKEKQVFIIDHNRTLLQMLDGCDKMQLVMQEEVTKMIV